VAGKRITLHAANLSRIERVNEINALSSFTMFSINTHMRL